MIVPKPRTPLWLPSRHSRLSGLVPRFQSPGNSSHRYFRPLVESLEERNLLSNIIWANRGGTLDTDGFNGVFGSGAPATAARNVVDAAISLWEDIITDFNQPFGGNTLAINISMSPFITDFGGFTTLNADPITGLPASGGITLFSGLDTDGDLLGDGVGYFIDPSPGDSAEFSGPMLNAFVGTAPTGTPAGDGGDFFTVVAHELGHILGIYLNPLLSYNRGGFNTNTEIPDNSFGGNGTYWVFDGPSFSVLMTNSNGGLAVNAPVHSAASGDAAFPIVFNDQAFTGHDDLMNASGSAGIRSLPSNANALVLHDAYGYDIASPERFGTFYALLNAATGNLLIRGGGPLLVADGVSDDQIRLSRDGDALVVSVDLGEEVPGVVLGSSNAYVSRFPFGSVSSITIDAGDGDDNVTLDFGGGDVIPAGGISYEGNTGTDRISAVASANFSLSDDLLLVFGFGSVELSSVEDAALTGNATANTFNVSSWSGTGALDGAGGADTLTAANQTGNLILSNTLLRSSGRGDISLQGIEQANLSGGTDDTQFTVSGWTGSATLNGGGGTNTVVSRDDASFTLSNSLLTRSTGGSFTLRTITRAFLTGGPSANSFTVGWTGRAVLNGGLGGDTYSIGLSSSSFIFGSYQIDDSGTSGSDLLTVNGTVFGDTLRVRKDAVLRGSQTVAYTGIEALQVNAGDSVDTITVESTIVPLTVNAGLGNDTVNVSYTRTLAIGVPAVFSIPASVTVNGGNGTTDTLNVSFNYEADIALTATRLTGAALGGTGLTYRTMERVNLTLGGLSDTVDILATGAAVTTSINTGGGNDNIVLGGVSVNSIRGPLSIDGGPNGTGSVDRITLQEAEPAGIVNQGFLGTPASAGPGVGFLGGFGMGGAANNVTFRNTENVQIVTSASNDFVTLQFATTPPRFTFNLFLDGGNDGIVFQGTNRNDRIHISRRVGPDGPEVVAGINGQTIVAGYQGGDTISVYAGAGNDSVTVDASVTTWRANLFGEAGNDHLVGGPLADLLDGGYGNDRLEGAESDDTLIGGPGQDIFHGGPGLDRVLAGDGDEDAIFADIADLLVSVDREDRIWRVRR